MHRLGLVLALVALPAFLQAAEPSRKVPALTSDELFSKLEKNSEYADFVKQYRVLITPVVEQMLKVSDPAQLKQKYAELSKDWSGTVQDMMPAIMGEAAGIVRERQEQIKAEERKAEVPVVTPVNPVPGGPPPPAVTPAQIRKAQADYLMSHRPDYYYGYYEAGQDEMSAKNFRGAFDKFGRAHQLKPNDADILFSYGSAAFNMGDTQLAVKCAQKALELAPVHKGAITLLRLSENRAPTVHLPNVLDGADKPGGMNITMNMPSSHPDAGGTRTSAPMVSAAPAMTPAEVAAAAQREANAPPSAVQQSAALTEQATAAMGVQDFSKAAELASRAIALNGRNAQAWNDRAIAYNKLGRYSDAVHDASFALGLKEGNAAALQTRSWAFAQSGNYKEALADANYSLERDPSNAFAFYNRAFAQAGLQDREGAVESLKKAAELDRRFQSTLDQALQAPKDSDLVFLFADVGNKAAPRAAAAVPAPGDRDKRFVRLMLVSVLGGVLVALGLLHVFSARWRQTVRATMRGLTGGSAGGEAPTDGFWSGYTVTKEIGSGGMGIVYEATDNALARRVAIKKMRDEIRADPVECQRFLTEARTVAALHHPNIVDIFSIVEDSGSIYLVFEYVDGRTLTQLLHEKGPLPLPEVRLIMQDVCAAVAYAHEQGVIHRDLKPSNIMLSNEGRIKVMDFGVARQAQQALTKAAQTNTIVGTPPYMAPEADQGSVRRESDVFALGVCFYEMLSARIPFAGQGAGMLLNKLQGTFIPLSQVAPGLPAGVDEVVAKALAPDPEQRYRTPEEFCAALRALPV